MKKKKLLLHLEVSALNKKIRITSVPTTFQKGKASHQIPSNNVAIAAKNNNTNIMSFIVYDFKFIGQ